jgi:hypothetical protein
MEIPKPNINIPLIEIFPIEEEKETPFWFTLIWKYLTRGILSGDVLHTRKIKRIFPMYVILNKQLNKRGYMKPWLKCVRE